MPPITFTGSKRILPSMAPRNLLICFDAFGTLFKPKRPVEQQYAEVARSMGLSGFSDEDVKGAFRDAFKKEAKQNPNYGKKTGMGAEKWWSAIIQNTFKPIIRQDQELPPDLIPNLLHRFWSDEGYTLFPDVQPLLQRLRNHYKANNGRMVVGVITNSDPRVPDVLSSLGLRVSPLRYGSEASTERSPASEYDVDFTVMSYDVGHEKPDRRIFEAAEEMLAASLKANENAADPVDASEWQKVYVGDEYDKDVVGAVGAGWNAVLVDRDAATQKDDVQPLDDQAPKDFESMFASSKAVGFSSLAKVAAWLPKPNL